MAETNTSTYAIIRTGGKQYKVQAGDTVRVEKLEKNLGDTFDLSDVLLVGGASKTYIGEPVLKGAKVTVVVTQQDRAPKVIVFRKKRRQGYRKMHGHRQMFTELFIQSITTPEGQTVTSEKKALVIDPEKSAARKAAVAEKQAARKAAPAAEGEEKIMRGTAPKKAKKSTGAKKSRKPAKKATKKKKASKKG